MKYFSPWYSGFAGFVVFLERSAKLHKSHYQHGNFYSYDCYFSNDETNVPN